MCLRMSLIKQNKKYLVKLLQAKNLSYEFEKLLAPLRSAWDFIARLVRFVVKNATAIIQLDMIALIVAYAL